MPRKCQDPIKSHDALGHHILIYDLARDIIKSPLSNQKSLKCEMFSASLSFSHTAARALLVFGFFSWFSRLNRSSNSTWSIWSNFCSGPHKTIIKPMQSWSNHQQGGVKVTPLVFSQTPDLHRPYLVLPRCGTFDRNFMSEKVQKVPFELWQNIGQNAASGPPVIF